MTAVRIHHVAIYVSDLERARRFFEDYFGGVAGKRYDNVATGFSSYFISLDGFACIRDYDATRSRCHGLTRSL